MGKFSIINKKIHNINPSMTMELEQKAFDLKNKGEDIISLIAGVSSFDAPKSVKNEAIKAIQENFTNYTSVSGILELKQAVLHKYKRDFGLIFNLNEVMITTGAKHSLHNIFNTILDKNDEVILHTPCWVSYPDMIKLNNAKPIFIEGNIKDNFILQSQDLEQAITKNTKIIVLNNPNNPSGIVYDEKDFYKIIKVIEKYPNIFIVMDEIYDLIYWDKKPANILKLAPHLKNRIILVNGVSKNYSMSGFRIGWTICEKNIIKAMIKFQSQSLQCPCSISQKASIPALYLSYDDLKLETEFFKSQMNFVYENLIKIKGIKIIKTNGAFYSFVNIEKLLLRLNIKNDIEFCDKILQEKGLALTPGSAFFLKNHIRITFSYSKEKVKQAIKRFIDFCS